jgi:ribosomal protein S18 acetylase RimI-like enzyme
MDTPPLIRLATPADLESLVGLHVEFRDSLQRTTPTADGFRDALAQLLHRPELAFFFATEQGRPLGYAAQRYLFSSWAQGEEALLEDLYVSAEARGAGLGRRLVEAAIAHARERGCRSMSLDTNENNAASNAVYRRLGFTSARARWQGGRQIRHDLKLERV